MNYAELRSKTRGIILTIGGILAFLVLVRVVFDFIKVGRGNFLVNFFYGITDILINPFVGSIGLSLGGGLALVNLDAIISIIFYVLIAIVASEVITAFLYEHVEDIIINLIDGVFKIIEFLVFLRIVFNFFNVSTNQIIPDVVRGIMALTNWTSGVVAPIPISGIGILDLSAIIVLFLVIILDIFSERFLYAIFKTVFNREKRSKERVTPNKTNVPIEQNITINLPPNLPQQQTKFVPIPVSVNTPSAQYVLPQKVDEKKGKSVFSSKINN